MRTRIDHVNIVVSDLEKAKDFFLAFGFIIEDEADLHGDWISTIVGLKNVEARYVKLRLPGSETRIELMHYRAPASGADPGLGQANRLGYRHIAFEVDDIGAVVKRLQDRGIKFLSPVQVYEPTGKKLVYFLGPDGILIELAQYRKSPAS